MPQSQHLMEALMKAFPTPDPGLRSSNFLNIRPKKDMEVSV